jgi:23S rRNA (pseudouridine1915-N3)-methyltransferase
VRFVVAAVGRLKTPHFAAACHDYQGRLAHTFPTTVVEIKDPPRTGGGRPEQWKAQEATGLLAALPPGGRLVALDERGRSLTSRAFAEWVGHVRDQGVPAVVFAIGGPDGLDESVRKRADMVLSFGAMTMPHELVRVVLLEQLYRAGAILSGSPYHRD